MNFAVNAIAALRGRQAGRRIELRVYHNSPKTILIEFSDNGCGMKPEMLEDVFLDFVTTKPSSENLGMGLSRVRKIVALHKGKAWAASEGQGKGSTFFVELPK